MELEWISSGSLVSWLTDRGVAIVVILIVAYVAQYASKRLVGRLVRQLISRGTGTKEAEVMRENTLIMVFGSTASILIWIVAWLMILSEAGIAIGPLLAAAGIAGVAVGFGGQYLIRDVITGLFILMENQYRVGDIVCFDGNCGLVEEISLRMTTLRDLDGTVHHIPHGEVKKVSNLSKGFARVNINIGISYSSDLEQVIAVVNRVGQEVADDPMWKEHIIRPPKFLRVNEFGDSAVVIKILGETKPLKQWDVAGELRKRLKIAFDKEGIEIPFPQRVVHQASASKKK